MDRGALALTIEELEARTSADLAGWLRGQYQACRDGKPLGPRLPAWLAAAELRGRLRRWAGELHEAEPALARRVKMLWRIAAKAAVEEDAEVVEAAGRAVGSERGLRDLLAARGRVARRMGWDGFLEMIGEIEEIDGNDVAAAETWALGAAQAAGTGSGSSSSSGWRQMVEAAGLPVDGIRVEVGGAARTFVIEPGQDVRVVVPEGAAMRLVLHEVGHAVYGMQVRGSWALRRAPARCLEEAVAELVADLAGERDGRWRRWQVARVHLEREAYADPDGPLEERWWKLACEHAGEVPRRSWWQIDHLRTDPGSQASYLVADLARARLGAALRWPGPEASRALVEGVLRPGAARPWKALLAGAGVAAL